MESNALCSLLVLTLTVPRAPPRTDVAVLCKLDYSDHTCCLPEEVSVQSEGRSVAAGLLCCRLGLLGRERRATSARVAVQLLL